LATSGRVAAVVLTLRWDQRFESAFLQERVSCEPEAAPVIAHRARQTIAEGVKAPLIETSGRLFFKAWELACYGGFLTGREAARYMGCRAVAAPYCSPAPLPAFAVAPATRRWPRRSAGCARFWP
jgi:hypothetical protein